MIEKNNFLSFDLMKGRKFIERKGGEEF